MTAYAARTRPGPPENGRYQLNDTVPDSNGTVWTCTKGGFAGDPFYAGAARFAPSVKAVYGSVPAAVAAYVTAEDTAMGAYHRTVFTFTNFPQAVVNGTEFQGTKFFTFPEGRMIFHGCIGTFTQRTTSDPTTTINTATGAFAIGTATASNVALTGAMADIAPSTAFTSSATINTPSTAFSPVLAATSAVFDGTGTAIAAFLNSGFATTTDVDADGTIDFSGTLAITWVHYGDK